ncbi:MAG: hypothetical protein JNL80_15120 [Phycisphaerae bacterium]|jgi:hypothetical protein|nr:hypothetical protein [Phycisphaerae bacterium]
MDRPRAAFGSVKELIAAIESYIAAHNRGPQTFSWTAKAEAILAKVRRAGDRGYVAISVTNFTSARPVGPG